MSVELMTLEQYVDRHTRLLDPFERQAKMRGLGRMEAPAEFWDDLYREYLSLIEAGEIRQPGSGDGPEAA